MLAHQQADLALEPAVGSSSSIGFAVKKLVDAGGRYPLRFAGVIGAGGALAEKLVDRLVEVDLINPE